MSLELKKTLVEASIDHGNILGLSDDDHEQYTLLSGRSGGQILYGGINSGDDLEIHSTSDAVKGVINLGDTAYIDEANNRLGVGTNAPNNKLAVNNGGIDFIDDDVNHGITDWWESNLYGKIDANSNVDGGLDFLGITDDNAGLTPLKFTAVSGSENPNDDQPMIKFQALKRSGTGFQAIGNNEIVAQWTNQNTELVTVMGSGNVGLGTVTPDTSLHITHLNSPIITFEDTSNIQKFSFGVSGGLFKITDVTQGSEYVRFIPDIASIGNIEFNNGNNDLNFIVNDSVGEAFRVDAENRRLEMTRDIIFTGNVENFTNGSIFKSVDYGLTFKGIDGNDNSISFFNGFGNVLFIAPSGTNNAALGVNGAQVKIRSKLVVDETAVDAFNVTQEDGTSIFNVDTTNSRIELGDGVNIILGLTTGTRLGISASEKLGIFGVTPVVQQSHITDADGTLADITTKFNTLLSQIEAIGINANS